MTHAAPSDEARWQPSSTPKAASPASAQLQSLSAPNLPSFQCRVLVKNLPLNTSLGNDRKVPDAVVPTTLIA